MPRPRQFEYDEAVDGAMQIFWEQGYAATNLPDLLKAMGLSRGSFYKAFEDKRSVYLAALKHYDKFIVSQAIEALEAPITGSLSDHFMCLFGGEPQVGPNGARRGCFICNAMVELAPTDKEVARISSGMKERMYGAVLKILKEHPQTTNDPLVEEKASAILHLYFGAQAINKAGTCTNDWKALLDDLLGGSS